MGNNEAADVPIVDIRGKDSGISMVDSIRRSLNPPTGVPRSLPTLLLYDGQPAALAVEIVLT